MADGFKRSIEKRTQRQSGQAIVLIALMMVGLMGILGMAIDGGGLFFLHRDTQNAVDAALIAALYAKCTGNRAELESQPDPDGTYANLYEKSIHLAALNAASKNGFTHGVNADITIESNYQPPESSNDRYIRVQIRAGKPSYFIQLVYPEPLEVTTSGVGYCEPSMVGLLPQAAIFSTRDTSDCNMSSNHVSIGNGGNSNFVVSGSIFAQSGNPTCAIMGRGNSSFTVSGACQAAGGFNENNLDCGSYEPNQPKWPSQNPLNGMSRPSCVPGENKMTAAELEAVKNLGIGTFSVGYKPGTYSSLSISNKDSVYLAPGLYCFKNSGEGIKQTGGLLYGDEVLLYFEPAANGDPANNGIHRNGGTVYLQSPAERCIPGSGQGATCNYRGLLVWKDTTRDVISDAGGNKNQLHLNGNGSDDQWIGMFYAPATECTFEGTSNATVTGMLVCYSVRGSGGGNRDKNLVVSYEVPDFLNTPPKVSLTE